MNNLDPRDNEEIWEDRANKYGSSFTRHPVGWIIGIIVVLAVVGTITSFVGGWFNADKAVFEPANVTKQYHFVISEYKNMEQQAEIVCEVQEKGSTESSPTFLENPAQAYASKYRQTESEYNTRQNNFFESKEVGPKGYPRNAPTLTVMEQKVCPR